MRERFYEEIISMIREGRIRNKMDLQRAKAELCRVHGLKRIPSDSEILNRLPEESRKEEVIELLKKKPSRSASGVIIVAVMTSPERCPHGRCVPCPGGVESNTPQSYTGFEPASMRAIHHDFDPFSQTRCRIEQLHEMGHAVDKVDFIVMGGTFMARDPFYREWFIKGCFDGMNGKISKNLEDAKRRNERGRSRCIGLTIETRPDWCRMTQIEEMLRYGATRVELGVQTVFDGVLEKMKRGHTVYDSILATRLAKDAGLKVCYHMMPGLPGSSLDMDLEAFETIFEDERFRPDMLKIYPTLVVRGTELYGMWKRGEYTPMRTEDAIHLLCKVKRMVPRWIRIQRIERDIPSSRIEAGIKESNLRQLVRNEMSKKGWRCECIRCREAGFAGRDLDLDNLELCRTTYRASDGEEVFLSFEDRKNDVLAGYLRLRLPGKPYIKEVAKGKAMIVRELKVVGREVPIGKSSRTGIQHKGIGKALLREAERIAREDYDCRKLLVLSGVGVRQYYRRLGYRKEGFYMSKRLDT